MAAGIPQEKAQEYLDEFSKLLRENKGVDTFTERRIRSELVSANTPMANIALSYLDALTDKVEESLRYLRLCLEVDDFILAQHYHYVLANTFNYRELRETTYKLASKYPSKQFSRIAFSWAYRFGEREELIHYFDQHIKLLSEKEGRASVVKHKEELLSEMDMVYEASNCSNEQFLLMASVVWDVLSDFKAAHGFVQLNSRGSYVVDVKNLSSNFIAKMNFELADRVCAIEDLDDCNLLARFSSPRDLHLGVSYNVNF